MKLIASIFFLLSSAVLAQPDITTFTNYPEF